jgi:hypothetical protein
MRPDDGVMDMFDGLEVLDGLREKKKRVRESENRNR